MSEYTLSQVSPTDKTTLAEIDALLQKEGIRRDGNLDYICAMFDEDYQPPFWRETPLPFWRTWATAGTGSALSEAAAEPQRAMCPKIISRSPELLCSGPSPRGRPGIFAVFGLTK